MKKRLANKLRAWAEKLDPPTLCPRCGIPYGIGGHGPGFCIDRDESRRSIYGG